MVSHTSPMAVDSPASVGDASLTNPTAAGFAPPSLARSSLDIAAASVASGTATSYWDESVAYPPGSAASLWLYVNNRWRHLDKVSPSAKDMVQRAFLGSGSSVRVWYTDNDVVVGLVVTGS